MDVNGLAIRRFGRDPGRKEFVLQYGTARIRHFPFFFEYFCETIKTLPTENCIIVISPLPALFIGGFDASCAVLRDPPLVKVAHMQVRHLPDPSCELEPSLDAGRKVHPSPQS